MAGGGLLGWTRVTGDSSVTTPPSRGHYPPLWIPCTLAEIRQQQYCDGARFYVTPGPDDWCNLSFHVNIDNGWQDGNLCRGAALTRIMTASHSSAFGPCQLVETV